MLQGRSWSSVWANLGGFGAARTSAPLRLNRQQSAGGFYVATEPRYSGQRGDWLPCLLEFPNMRLDSMRSRPGSTVSPMSLDLAEQRAVHGTLERLAFWTVKRAPHRTVCA